MYFPSLTSANEVVSAYTLYQAKVPDETSEISAKQFTPFARSLAPFACQELVRSDFVLPPPRRSPPDLDGERAANDGRASGRADRHL